jgi:NADH-quinone oxidoreductase subunit L
MFGQDFLLAIFGFGVLGAPLLLLGILGLSSLIDRPLSERLTSKLVAAAVFTGLGSSLGIITLMAIRGEPHMSLEYGQWISVRGFHFSVKFLFDWLSMPFVILAFVLTGTIGGFANRYMHREPGFNRFFFLYALFIAGMTMTSLAGTIETLFAGWEMVGLSSALLVAFFHERAMPVRNGLRVWIVYRVSDAALLIAAVVLHHLQGAGEGDFDILLGAGAWPHGQANIDPSYALVVGLLLLVAAAGKSALVPFSGWLPRAMEGPTPSSAVFYGAISVHLGAFLLLRISPILDISIWLSVAVTVLGLLTAMFGTLAGRAQTDIKSALSFASVTQVGIIVAEIGLGLRYIALAHIIGHASLRTLQFLRAPMLLQDYRTLENAIGARLPRITGWWGRWLPDWAQNWLYRFALERGYLDAYLDDYIARPFLSVFEWCAAAEGKWTEYLGGDGAHVEHVAPVSPEPLDELL